MYIFSIDLGGTKIAFGILDLKGRIIARSVIQTPSKAPPQKVISIIAKEFKKLIETSKIKFSEIKGLGVGIPGQILREQGIVVTSPNLPKWKNVQIKKPLEKLTKLKVFIDNDANAATLGELYFGAGQGEKDFLYVTVSTGIGGGIVVNGKIYRGARNAAGEIGHMVIISSKGYLCGCGNKGCWEALASGNAFARHARERLKNFKGKTILRKLIKNKLRNLDAKILEIAVRKNDVFAKKVWKESAFYLGLGFANLVNIFNPSLIIVGGGFALSGDLIFKPIKKIIKKFANPVASSSVKIIPAKLQANSGLLGAGALVLEGINK